jgi:hypothetical protein
VDIGFNINGGDLQDRPGRLLSGIRGGNFRIGKDHIHPASRPESPPDKYRAPDIPFREKGVRRLTAPVGAGDAGVFQKPRRGAPVPVTGKTEFDEFVLTEEVFQGGGLKLRLRGGQKGSQNSTPAGTVPFIDQQGRPPPGFHGSEGPAILKAAGKVETVPARIPVGVNQEPPEKTGTLPWRAIP